MISDNEITALLGRGGYDPDRLLSRRDTSLLLHRLGVSLSERTIAKNVALRRDAPPYRISPEGLSVAPETSSGGRSTGRFARPHPTQQRKVKRPQRDGLRVRSRIV